MWKGTPYTDIEIGGVEIKNATTDDRADINDANTARATTTHVIAIQGIDATGKVSPAGETNANSPYTRITDGTQQATIADDSAQLALPAMLNVGGEYRASSTTYTDGDATILQTNVNGHAKIAGSHVHDIAVIVDGVQTLAEAKDFDNLALPNAVGTEGDAIRIAASLSGIQYIMPVNEDGSKTPLAVDDSAMVATPDFLGVGGEYRTAATTYSDGDATILQSDVNGYLKVATAGVSKYENPTFAETESEAEDSEFATSVTYGLDTEAVATSQLRAVQVAVDNAGISATPNVLTTGGIYKNAWDTYDDNDASPLHMDVNGHLVTTIFDGATETDILADGADTVANTENEFVTGSMNYGFNGVSWDRQRNLDALAGVTAGAGVTLKNLHNDELGINPSVMMGYDNTIDANAYRAVHVDTAGNIVLSSDIEIGAVELKDASTDNRADINDANTVRAVTTHVIATQQIDATGVVPAAGNLVGNAPFVKPTDGTTAVGVIVATTALKSDLSSVAGTATAVSSGVTDAGTQRVILASNDPAVTSLAIMDDWDAVHDTAIGTDGSVILSETKNFDGLALTAVNLEGDASRIASTLQGVIYTIPVIADGSKTPLLAEDTAHVTGDIGHMALAVRSDVLGAIAGTTGDYSPVQVNASGALYTDIAMQTLTAVKVSKDASANIVTNPIWSELTDGTAAISATNPLDVQLGDGTNVVPILAGTVKTLPASIHDGTTLAGVLDGATHDALKVAVTDGTNIVSMIDIGATNTGIATGIFDAVGNRLPAMATSATAGYIKITDGTDDADVVTLAGVADNLDGMKGIVTASLLYARATDDSATPITLSGIAAQTDNIDGNNGLNTCSAIYARIDANTVEPLAMIDTVHSLKTDLSSYGGTAVSGTNPIVMKPGDPSEQELIDTTNVAAGTNYYPADTGLTMSGYNDLDVQYVLTDADGTITMTLEATLDDAVPPDWIDITKSGYELNTNSVGNASYLCSSGSASGIVDWDNLNVKSIRIKSVTNGATNAVQYHIRRKI